MTSDLKLYVSQRMYRYSVLFKTCSLLVISRSNDTCVILPSLIYDGLLLQ